MFNVMFSVEELGYGTDLCAGDCIRVMVAA